MYVELLCVQVVSIEVKYLFWNTYRNEGINAVITELVTENDIDILILAEYTANSKELVSFLSNANVAMEEYGSCSERIKLFGKIENIEYRTDTEHAIIRVINNEDILCCVHLNSKISSGNKEQREILIDQILEDVRKVEDEFQTENTIIVGDFNINPYDESFVDARYFHGIPVYEEAKRGSRVVARKRFRMFYNPMWNFLGDFQEPYGTYYHAGSDAIQTYWNIFDQVIIRPILKERFVSDSLRILTETQKRFLLDHKGHPDKKISDHLPIMFEIKEAYHGENT